MMHGYGIWELLDDLERQADANIVAAKAAYEAEVNSWRRVKLTVTQLRAAATIKPQPSAPPAPEAK